MDYEGIELTQKVDEVIETLYLSKQRNKLIGNREIKGLGPADKKKTSIAIELISDPSILFLDEPTSGLDSFAANKLVKLLIQQARAGKTVIATIHQPNSSTFAIFDRLLLLMDGHAIYQGVARDAVKHFEKLGFVIPRFSNPADYFLKEFFIPFKKTQRDIDKIDLLVDGYLKYIDEDIKTENELIKHEEITSDSLKDVQMHCSFWPEFQNLLIRTLKNVKRTPAATKVRLFQMFSIIVLNILVFWDLGYSQKDVTGKVGF